MLLQVTGTQGHSKINELKLLDCIGSCLRLRRNQVMWDILENINVRRCFVDVDHDTVYQFPTLVKDKIVICVYSYL